MKCDNDKRSVEDVLCFIVKHLNFAIVNMAFEQITLKQTQKQVLYTKSHLYFRLHIAQLLLYYKEENTHIHKKKIFNQANICFVCKM